MEINEDVEITLEVIIPNEERYDCLDAMMQLKQIPCVYVWRQDPNYPRRRDEPLAKEFIKWGFVIYDKSVYNFVKPDDKEPVSLHSFVGSKFTKDHENLLATIAPYVENNSKITFYNKRSDVTVEYLFVDRILWITSDYDGISAMNIVRPIEDPELEDDNE